MIRTCTVCFEPVPPRYVLCGNCFESHREYIKSGWFQELIKMQVRQDYITYREQFTTEDYALADAVQPSATHWRRSVGRPRVLSRKEADQLVKEYEESLIAAREKRGKRLSYRALARKYNVNRMTVSRAISRLLPDDVLGDEIYALSSEVPNGLPAGQNV